MIDLAVHPEVHIQELREHPAYSTCRECHRSFRAKCEDQLSLELCDHCFDALRHPSEPVLSVHVKARPRRPAAL